eukprot:TRINITY_DN1202_c1_g1_i3.p1 TRINITY_DN1202_c1_g1~~TRINITY_DN1202_c1_g1_i3.p1  ORF type:complete len:464 (+),score=87.23 TRINITY_DN1202_c1_g1_i3:81-1394(+)
MAQLSSLQPALVCGQRSGVSLLSALLLQGFFLACNGKETSKNGVQAHEMGGIAIDLAFARPKEASRNVGLHGPATCELPANSGIRNGICHNDVEGLRSQLTFCKEAVRYRACVPAHQPLWEDWNASTKDALVAKQFREIVDRRLAMEANNTPNVYVDIHLLANADCIAAFKNVLCWMTFPKCNDQNVSAPLCRKSCERYYDACLYQRNTDGVFEQCKEANLKYHGLFGMGKGGPEQTLGEDNVTCKSTEAEVAAIPLPPPPPDWYTTWWGISLLVALGLGVAYFVGKLLVPIGIKDYLAWKSQRIISLPYRIYQRLCWIPGQFIVWMLVLTFLGLFGYGIYRRVVPSAEGAFERFEDVRERVPEPPQPFAPPASVFEVDTKQALSNQARREVIGRCSCTGAAVRIAAPRWMGNVFTWVVALGGLLSRAQLPTAASRF